MSGRSTTGSKTACAPTSSSACSPIISNGTCASAWPSCSTTTPTRRPPRRSARARSQRLSDRPPPSPSRPQAEPTIIDDGSTIQTDLGRFCNEALRYLHHRKDLGIHSNVITSPVLDLIHRGVVTGRHKTLHHGKVVTSFCLGDRKLYEFIDANPMFEFRTIEYVANPAVVAQNYKMVSLSQALAIDLTGEVYRQSLRQGDHFVVLGHDRWICHIFDRAELEHRVCIDEFIQLPVAKTEARHNLPVVQSLVTSGHDAAVDQIEHRTRDDIGMDAEVLPVVEVPKRLVAEAPKVGLDGGAVVDDLRDILRYPLGDLIVRRMLVFSHGRIDRHDCREPLDMQETVAQRPGHVGIHFRDDRLCSLQHTGCDIDRYAEADIAMRIGRRDLNQRHIWPDPAVRRQFGDLGERNWNVLRLATRD